MIFVTVGSMLPFDRLIMAMDEWAAAHPHQRMLAQIGDGTFLPRYMPYSRIVTPARFREIYDEANLIVAHAGMGSVIMAAETGKPIVLLPRQAARREHTTDHQLHTVAWLGQRPGIFVADAAEDLAAQIGRAQAWVGEHPQLSKIAPMPFVEKIRQAVEN